MRIVYWAPLKQMASLILLTFVYMLVRQQVTDTKRVKVGYRNELRYYNGFICTSCIPPAREMGENFPSPDRSNSPLLALFFF